MNDFLETFVFSSSSKSFKVFQSQKKLIEHNDWRHLISWCVRAATAKRPTTVTTTTSTGPAWLSRQSKLW